MLFVANSANCAPVKPLDCAWATPGILNGVKEGVSPSDKCLGESWVPSGKRLHNYGKSPFFMGKLTISMAIFNSYFDITRG